MRKTIKLYDEDCCLSVYNYVDNNRLYLGVSDKNNDIIQDISVNLPEVHASYNQIYLTEPLSKDVVNKLVRLGIISKPVKEVQYNMATAKLVDVNLDKLKDYDKEGVEKYLKNCKKRDKEQNDNTFYSSDEIMDLLKKETRLVYVDLGNEEVVARYEDIPDIITDINYNKKGPTDISVYDFKSPENGPILTTFGPYLNTCNPDVRKDIIDRLCDLQMGEATEKEYKVIDEDVLEEVKDKLEQNELER